VIHGIVRLSHEVQRMIPLLGSRTYWPGCCPSPSASRPFIPTEEDFKMKAISFAVGGGVCSSNRIKATARCFEEVKGPAALATFLRSVAGVANVADVPGDDRFRVNAAMRAAIQDAEASTPPLHKALARIGSRAFAKMVRR
jgi:hypothetical protein